MVLGDVTVREAVVVEPLFAVLLLFFEPAKISRPISSSIETPATQLHMPPTFSSRPLVHSSRRITGSLKRGSVKRGSVMASSLVRDALHEGNPLAVSAVPNLDPVLLDGLPASLKLGRCGLFKVPGTPAYVISRLIL